MRKDANLTVSQLCVFVRWELLYSCSKRGFQWKPLNPPPPPPPRSTTQPVLVIHWESQVLIHMTTGVLTSGLSASSSESLCWRAFWKSATRASLDCSCLCRSPISLLLDCSCTQWHSQYTNGQSRLLSHI